MKKMRKIFIPLSWGVTTAAVTLSSLNIPSSELMPNGRMFVLLGALIACTVWSLLAALIISLLKQFNPYIQAIFTLPVFIHPILWILMFFSMFQPSDEAIKPLALIFLIGFLLLAVKIREFLILMLVAIISLLAFFGDAIMMFTIFINASGDF